MKNYNNEEIANYFVLCFLMPEDEYQKIFNQNLSPDKKTVNTKKIAEHFNVDINIASLRDVHLNLIKEW